jgi:hypothetical protein
MKVFLATFLVFAISINDAYAYLDPGTGSIIVQGIIGAIAGGLVVGKLYWYKLKNLLSRSKTGDASPKR